MLDTLQRSSGMGGVLTPPHHRHSDVLQDLRELQPTDLSPGRSLPPSSGSSGSGSTHSSEMTPQKNGGGAFEEGSGSALQRLQFALEKNVLFSGLFSPESEKEGSGSHQERSPSDPGTTPEQEKTQLNSEGDPVNIFQCPLCSVQCNSRHAFNEHLVSHTSQAVCPKCSFFTDEEEKLTQHMREEHDLNDMDGLSGDEEVSVPKVNSQGRVKTFKCKQCQYVTVTKMDFWAHSKSHIRTEKMLNCPKCPFVTEYKHHLEYHLRNHFGSKPFQCTKCAYTCVNKSMLNSHLKSHSNIYQYRCADCSYATKYCHSLKLHLRKYSHNPSIVLNPDGSPNPLPIIDVYGTRRGPKMKRDSTGVNLGQVSSPPMPKEDLPSPLPPPPSKQKPAKPQKTQKPPKKPQSKPIPEPLPPHYSSESEEEVKPQPKSPLELYAAAALNSYLMANQNYGFGRNDMSSFTPEMAQAKLLASLQMMRTPQFGVGTLLNHQSDPGHVQENDSSPLDLRSNPKNGEEKRRKRKGVAQRFFSRGEDEEEDRGGHEMDQDMVLDFSNNNLSREKLQAYRERESTVSELQMTCKFCEISFPDHVLYSMHMRYHSGEDDPFLCRSCGKKTRDKISFFHHLTTDSH